MATFVEHAATGDWRSALRASITTGVVVAQATAWDRVFGALFSSLFGADREHTLATATAQAISTTALGVTTIFVLHRVST